MIRRASVSGPQVRGVLQSLAGNERLDASAIKNLPAGVLQETIASSEQPGTGANILQDGEGRIWTNTDTGLTYLVTRVGANYKLVELS